MFAVPTTTLEHEPIPSAYQHSSSCEVKPPLLTSVVYQYRSVMLGHPSQLSPTPSPGHNVVVAPLLDSRHCTRKLKTMEMRSLDSRIHSRIDSCGLWRRGGLFGCSGLLGF